MNYYKEINGKEYQVFHTTCSCCGKGMNWGYVISGGEEYYCSKECRESDITEEQFQEMYNDLGGNTYWTEWEDKDDMEMVLLPNGKIVNLSEIEEQAEIRPIPSSFKYAYAETNGKKYYGVSIIQSIWLKGYFDAQNNTPDPKLLNGIYYKELAYTAGFNHYNHKSK